MMVVLSLAYLFLLPIWQSHGNTILQPRHLYGARLVDLLVFGWCLWIGSSIGSFLNVVAWRIPRGESINGRSHCPRCQSQLRARDNVPVLGWLSLGGRCYCCKLPISKRYPIVELAVGFSLAMLCFAELYQLNLPRQDGRNHYSLFASPVVEWNTILVAIYHLVIVSFSWACGLVRLDGHRLPTSLTRLALALAVLPMLLEPTLMVVPWQMEVDSNWSPSGEYLDAIMRVLTSVVAATVMGRILVPAFCPTADLKLDPLGGSTARLIDLIVILALPSLVIGWHSLSALVLFASVFAALLQPKLDWKKDALGCFAVSIPFALTLQLVFWRSLHAPIRTASVERGTWFWPSESGSTWVILIWVALTLTISVWLRDFDPPDRQSNVSPDLDQDSEDELEKQSLEQIENEMQEEIEEANTETIKPEQGSGEV